MTRPETTAAFWENVAEGRLAYPRCPACGAWHSYPRAFCIRCLHEPLALEPVSGAGTVHAVTVVHRALTPAFAEQVPYAHVLIDLDEGVRVLSRAVGGDPAAVTPGMRVRAVVEDGLVLYRPV